MVYALLAVILILVRFLYVQDNNNRAYQRKVTNEMLIINDSLHIVTSPNHIGAMPVLIRALLRSLEHNRSAFTALLQLNIPNSPEANTVASELRYAQASAKQALCRVVLLLVELEQKGQKIRRLVDDFRLTDMDADEVFTALNERYPSDGAHAPLLRVSDVIPGHWKIGRQQ
ncbi:hypothetical protein N6147_001893 [Proteus mirabilis]|nr:hypothetical protein [Proteus mirabilis]